MAKRIATLIEVGPKGKRFVALARDWPGLVRGGKTEDAALDALGSYVGRYAAVAKRAGLGDEFPADGKFNVVERYEGRGMTDFWGISFALAPSENRPLSVGALDRQLALLAAVWAEFDAVRARVSPTLARGPRGGGRDRDQVVRHVLLNEEDWAKSQLAIVTAPETILRPAGLKAHRSAVLEGIRDRRTAETPPRKWSIRFLLRHTAYHVLDHTWEMQDKDLTGSRRPAGQPAV